MSEATIQDLIGDRFENIFQAQFPDFVKQDKGKKRPDFFNGDVWVETKTGFLEYGVRIKLAQVKSFRKLKEPVLYAIGFHDFARSITRLAGFSPGEIEKILEGNMDITRGYLVSDRVIRGIWEAENRISKKEGVNYCMLKERFLRNLISDKKFVRNGKVENCWGYYGVHKYGLLRKEAGQFEESSPSKYGLILDSKDEVTMNFAREKGLI